MGSATNWADDEPVLSETAMYVTTRLLQRSRFTWPVWFGIVFTLTALLVVQKVRRPPIIPAEVVIRLVEGSIEMSQAPLSTRVIRGKTFDLAFTRPHLIEVLRRHRAALSKPASDRLARDPVAAVDDLLADVLVVVSQNDFVQYRDPNDPPRSVKISVSYKNADSELAWAIARDLADLVVKAQVGVKRREIELQAAVSSQAQAQTAAELRSFITGKKEHIPTRPVPVESSTEPLDPTVDSDEADPAEMTEDYEEEPTGILGEPLALLTNLDRRADAAAKQDTANRFLLRAIDEKQGLHLELVDPGRPPVRVRGLAAAQGVLLGFPVVLLLAALVAGAFDPRVLDDHDLRALGLLPLGHTRVRDGRV